MSFNPKVQDWKNLREDLLYLHSFKKMHHVISNDELWDKIVARHICLRRIFDNGDWPGDFHGPMTDSGCDCIKVIGEQYEAI